MSNVIQIKKNQVEKENKSTEADKLKDAKELIDLILNKTFYVQNCKNLPMQKNGHYYDNMH